MKRQHLGWHGLAGDCPGTAPGLCCAALLAAEHWFPPETVGSQAVEGL